MTVDYNKAGEESFLISRNIQVLKKRTSVRLELEMWQELKNITEREKCTIHDLCSLIYIRKNKRASLTASIRVFIMLYYRAATTEVGHTASGHGDFDVMKTRAGVSLNWSANNTLIENKSEFNNQNLTPCNSNIKKTATN